VLQLKQVVKLQLGGALLQIPGLIGAAQPGRLNTRIARPSNIVPGVITNMQGLLGAHTGPLHGSLKHGGMGLGRLNIGGGDLKFKEWLQAGLTDMGIAIGQGHQPVMCAQPSEHGNHIRVKFHFLPGLVKHLEGGFNPVIAVIEFSRQLTQMHPSSLGQVIQQVWLLMNQLFSFFPQLLDAITLTDVGFMPFEPVIDRLFRVFDGGHTGPQGVVQIKTQQLKHDLLGNHHIGG